MNHSFKLGLALGMTGKPLPISKPEPVAYLYNGVRLPKLPEWNKSKYPYVVINKDRVAIKFYYSLYLCSDMPFRLNGLEFYDIKLPTIRYKQVEADAKTWGNPELLTEEDGRGPYNDEGNTDVNGRYWYLCSDPIWSNFDFYYTKYEGHEGELYLAASDPIPIYE